jgi:hypothetical protein
MIFFQLYSFEFLVTENLNLGLGPNPDPGSIYQSLESDPDSETLYILHCARLVCHCPRVKNRVFTLAKYADFLLAC